MIIGSLGSPEATAGRAEKPGWYQTLFSACLNVKRYASIQVAAIDTLMGDALMPRVIAHCKRY